MSEYWTLFASELAEDLTADSGFHVPAIDWARTTRRVMTMAWIEGIKLTDVAAPITRGLASVERGLELIEQAPRETGGRYRPPSPGRSAPRG